ncbi:hypothetical protein HY633_01290 [Candidatus Uhrbacteria bacterium]|nr:hypothetical protein [Candidatus Uhrbacteria bacterium]
MTTIVPPPVVVDPDAIGERIRRRRDQARLSTIETGRDLARMKWQLPYGEFLPFVRRLGIAPRTAQRAMRLAKAAADQARTREPVFCGRG